MKKLQLACFTILYSLFSISCCSLFASSTDDLLRQMEDVDSRITDISFSFEQEILITLTNEKTISVGKAVFKKPNLFKIEHSGPEKQTIVNDGKNTFFYQKEFEQVMVDGFKAQFNFYPTISELNDKYDILLSYADETEKYFVLLLTAKSQTQDTQDTKVKLCVSKETYLVSKIETKSDTLVSTIKISNIKTNKGMKDSFFKFKIPKGTQIIHG